MKEGRPPVPPASPPINQNTSLAPCFGSTANVLSNIGIKPQSPSLLTVDKTALGGVSPTRTFLSHIVLRIPFPFRTSSRLLTFSDVLFRLFSAIKAEHPLRDFLPVTVHSHVCQQSASPQRSEEPSRSPRPPRRRITSPPSKTPSSSSSKGFNHSRQLATQHAFRANNAAARGPQSASNILQQS